MTQVDSYLVLGKISMLNASNKFVACHQIIEVYDIFFMQNTYLWAFHKFSFITVTIISHLSLENWIFFFSYFSRNSVIESNWNALVLINYQHVNILNRYFLSKS